jgi:hypothetical protein
MRLPVRHALPFRLNRVRESCEPRAYGVAYRCVYLVRTGVRQGGHIKRKLRALEMHFGGPMKCAPPASRRTGESASPARGGYKDVASAVRNTR